VNPETKNTGDLDTTDVSQEEQEHIILIADESQKIARHAEV
jgi:hypothetical protein